MHWMGAQSFFCLSVPGFPGQLFKHFKNLSGRSKKIEKQKKYKSAPYIKTKP